MSVPALRFPAFLEAGEWEEKRLGDIGSIVTGNTPSTADTANYGGTHLFVSPGEISDERYIKNTKIKLTDIGVKKARLIQTNSILFVCIGSTIGKIAQNEVECATNQQLNAIIPSKKYSNDFIYSILFYESENIALLAGRHAVPIVNKTVFSSFMIKTPTLQEQQKIADCLASIDALITTQAQTIDSLKIHKKGLMQQLFPAEGLANPSLRFPAFSDTKPWVKVTGNLLFEQISNKNHDSTLPILAITQGNGAIPRNLINYQVSVTDKSIESYKVVKKDDFIISLRSFQGGIEYSNYEGICSPAYVVLRNITLVSKQFFKHFFKTDVFINDLNKNIEGLRDGKMISYKQFSILLLPSTAIKEQQKIADCLSSIDELISIHTMQLDALKTFKKGLMQGLFPASTASKPTMNTV